MIGVMVCDHKGRGLYWCPTCEPSKPEMSELVALAVKRAEKAEAEAARLQEMVRGLTDRVAAQSELLGRKAEAQPKAARCAGVSARWCPVHGDCTCQPDDLNDDDRPLHSATSSHGEDAE